MCIWGVSSSLARWALAAKTAGCQGRPGEEACEQMQEREREIYFTVFWVATNARIVSC